MDGAAFKAPQAEAHRPGKIILQTLQISSLAAWLCLLSGLPRLPARMPAAVAGPQRRACAMLANHGYCCVTDPFHTLQGEVFNGAILQQSFSVEFVVADQPCTDCNRHAANPNVWVAAVQVIVTSLAGLGEVVCSVMVCSVVPSQQLLLSK